jgi:hypothetical protein
LIRRFADVRPPSRIQGAKGAKMKGGKKTPNWKKTKIQLGNYFFPIGKLKWGYFTL